MTKLHDTRICLVPRLSGIGGMVSFQAKLAQGLSARGVDVTYDLKDEPYEAVLVIGGTRGLWKLREARKRGARIVQRLNGMNWVHRVRTDHGKLRTGVRHYLRSEYGNLILSVIRSRVADRIVYQSQFSKSWWERVRGDTQVPNSIVYNGVDLNLYSPEGPNQRPDDGVRMLMVEGSLMGGYEMGLDAALQLAQGLVDSNDRRRSEMVELQVVGRVSPDVREKWEQRVSLNSMPSNLKLTWQGEVSQTQIPEIDRSAHILYSADVNAACPNSVIEAQACGLPVVAFDTGALSELVKGDAGRVVPYGSDVWRLEPPDVQALVTAAREVMEDQPRFRRAARTRAEAEFGLDMMVGAYLHALVG